MPVCFNRGATLGRGDVYIKITNAQGAPTDPSSISFSLAYVDPGPPETEVPIGPPFDREPVRAGVGEYYAAILLPETAPLGDYRVRWTFKECEDFPEQTIVQVFGIVQETTILNDGYSDVQRECIRRLRVLLRDNCIGEEEIIEVNASGTLIKVSIGELYELVGKNI